MELVGDDHLARSRADRQPVLLACWHGEMLPLLWYHRNQGIALLVSEHRDGELIARVAASLGFTAVRGSTSRGGGRALLGLVRELRDGRDVAVTPDGPRGPRGEFSPGALVAAQRAGVPVLPVVAAADRAWRLSSWDRFLIPRPFARVAIAYGQPASVGGSSPREAGAEVARFSELLAAAAERARSAL